MKNALIVIMIALIGVGLFSYPHISSYLSEKNGSYAADDYDTAVKEADEKALKEAWEEAVKYNQSLSGNPVHDPFIEGSGMVMQDNYYEVLTLQDMMGYITIPKINVKIPILHGTAEDTLQNAVGHLEGSSIPVGGSGSHCVLTGHTGLVHAKLFTDLIELKEGDTFYLHILNKILAYQVDQIKVIEPDNTEDMKRIPNEDYCTLITCTPYGVNSHRLLVRGTRIDYTPELEETAAKAEKPLTKEEKMLIIAGASTAVLMLVIIVIILARTNRRNKKRRIEELKSRV